MDLKARAKKLKTDVPAVFLALKDRRTPWYAKIIAAIVVVYALSPVDLVPDFIPVLGYLDDVIILPALIALRLRRIPPDTYDHCRVGADGMWASGTPKTCSYAIPFVLIWLAVVALVILAIA